MQVEVRTSKTDRDSHGRTAALPYGAHSVTCPVRTAQAWLAELADHDRSSGPLFVRIDRHGGLGRTPTGRGSSDGRLAGQDGHYEREAKADKPVGRTSKDSGAQITSCYMVVQDR